MLLDLAHLAVEYGVTNPPWKSMLHGGDHWRAVALTGIWIAKRTPQEHEVHVEFVMVFAQLHDIMRESDGHDPDHGRRAAALYGRLVEHDLVAVFPAMEYALALHADGFRSEHPDVNVGVCWDADRLQLPRVGIEPSPALLSTEAGRSKEAREYGRRLSLRQVRTPTWEEIAGEGGVSRTNHCL